MVFFKPSRDVKVLMIASTPTVSGEICVGGGRGCA
jgi:hypothetical protein